MEIKIENVKAAFNTADESGKKLLLALFPELSSETAQKADNRPVTERIKTFEDAMLELGEEHPFVKEWHLGENLSPELEAYLQLRVICVALNEGWEPKFTEDEVRWFPWFWLYTQDEINNMDEQEKQARHLIYTGDYETEYAGFAYAHSLYAPSHTLPYFGSRLCLKSEALAVYCGKQFIDLWADFNLVRRR
jgi:hypothetical protein